MMKVIEKTNGKKTTYAAIAYVVLSIVRLKYPNFFGGHDILVEQVFTIIFGSTLFHKLWRNIEFRKVFDRIKSIFTKK